MCCQIEDRLECVKFRISGETSFSWLAYANTAESPTVSVIRGFLLKALGRQTGVLKVPRGLRAVARSSEEAELWER